VKQVIYRPANGTIAHRRLEALAPQERELVRELGEQRMGTNDPRLGSLAPARAAATVEAAYDLVNYRRAIGDARAPEPAALSRELLLARGSLEAPSQLPAIATPQTRPDEGHGTARLGFGAG